MNHVRSWLELARLSNLPTVWADVLVGMTAGYVTWAVTHHQPLPAMDSAYLLGLAVGPGIWIFVGLSLMYVAGMILNDVADVKIDLHDRPNRPLPNKHIRVRTAGIVAVVLLVLGLAALGSYVNWVMIVFGIALVGAIVGYDLLHHRSPWTIFLMGVCRALVILTAASWYGVNALWSSAVGPIAVIVLLYTVLFTIIARLETKPYQDERRYGSLGMIVIVWLALCSVQPAGGGAWGWVWMIIVGLGTTAWLGWAAWLVFHTPPRTGTAVGAWIAGLALADAFYLTLYNQPVVAAVAVGCFILTLLGHQWVKGT